MHESRDSSLLSVESECFEVRKEENKLEARKPTQRSSRMENYDQVSCRISRPFSSKTLKGHGSIAKNEKQYCQMRSAITKGPDGLDANYS